MTAARPTKRALAVNRAIDDLYHDSQQQHLLAIAGLLIQHRAQRAEGATWYGLRPFEQRLTAQLRAVRVNPEYAFQAMMNEVKEAELDDLSACAVVAALTTATEVSGRLVLDQLRLQATNPTALDAWRNGLVMRVRSGSMLECDLIDTGDGCSKHIPSPVR